MYTLRIQSLLANGINTKAMRSGSAVQIFLANTQTFTKDTAMSKMTVAQSSMCQLTQHDIVWALWGNSPVCVNNLDHLPHIKIPLTQH